MDEFVDELPFDPRNVPTVAPELLPAEIRWMYAAEQHRLRTGETLKAEDYRRKYGDLKNG